MFPKQIPDRTITVFTTPRPMRIAVVIDAESEMAISDFEQTAYCFGNLWGGRYNAVVLSRGGGLDLGWRRVLELVDPDCIYSICALDEPTVDWVNTRCCPAIFRNGDDVARRAGERLNVFSMLKEHPARITSMPSAIASRTGTLFSPKFYYIHGSGDGDPYKQFLVHNFGVLSEDVGTKDAFLGTDVVEYNLREEDSHAVFTELSRHGTGSRFTPDVLSASNTHPVAGDGGKYEHQFTIVAGDTIHDLALFRAVKMLEDSAGGRQCAWVPTALLTNGDAITLLRNWVSNSYWSGGDNKRVQVVSRSIPDDNLQPLATKLNEGWQLSASIAQVPDEDLGLPSPVELFIPTESRQDWRTPAVARLTKAQQCGIVDRCGVLDVHVPDFLQHISHHEQIMLDLEIPYLRNEESSIIVRSGAPKVWRLPQRQGLACAFLPASLLSRIERRGLPACVLTRNMDLLPVRIPTPREMFYCCMSNDFISKHDVSGRRAKRFTSWRSSDEGYFLAALVELFGSPYACGHTLAEPFWGPMLRELVLGSNAVADITNASAERVVRRLAEHEGAIDITTDVGRDKAVEYLTQHAQASPRIPKGYSKRELMNAFGRFKQSAPKGHWYWDKANRKDCDIDRDLNMYVEADVLRMGIRYRCEACLTQQWVSVDDIGSHVKCTGCGARNHLGSEPEWRYQVNTLAAEAIRRRGIIAVVQALYSVEFAPPFDSFAALPCTDIFDGDSNQPYTDLDLVYFANREFVIGEVKHHPTGFTEAHLTKLRDIAADVRPNRVVFAAPEGEWPPAIEQLFHQYAEEQKPLGITWEMKRLKW
jgi:hypothetical protein